MEKPMAEPPPSPSPSSAPPPLNQDENIMLDSDSFNDQYLSLEDALDLDFDFNFYGFGFEQFDSTAIPPQGISQFPIAYSHSPDLNQSFANCDSDIPLLISPESANSAISDALGDQSVSLYLKSSSEDSENEGSPDSGFKVSAVVSSHDSSDIRPSNSLSTPHLGNSEVDQKVDEEDVRNSYKRKKDGIDGSNGESKTSKHQKSENCFDKNDEEQKHMVRLMRNRESAQLSRQRRKNYIEELENKVRSLHSTITDLNGKISYAMAENASLRQQLSSSGIYPLPPPGMYPPMGAYPWASCSPYLVKPQGSQVPLVPIPRLRPQQPVSATATAIKGKRTDNKKHDRNTKKVASVTFFGLLFFIFLFGGLLPNLNVRFSTLRNNVSHASSLGSREFDDQHRGRVLEVDSQLNRSNEILGIRYINGKSHHVDSTPQHVKYHTRESQPLSNSEELIHLDNSSEPLVASLYVPRNDKLVKIDGNLIIHSILASERTMASRHALKHNTNEETGLAIRRNLDSALAIPDAGSNKGRHSHVYKRHTELWRALPSGSADDALGDAPVGNGKVQQWFREGLAGPMLSSGMCTEVFQFEVSPASVNGAITVANNISSEESQNATQLNKRKNRRILHGLPLHLSGSNNKVAREANKSISSSMIVSVLADPRQAGDIDGMITAKSLSRILVVVLLDRVKYVTYSCVLPRAGHHLVAA